MLQKIFRAEATPGVLLVLSALAATLLVNSAWGSAYLAWLKTPMPVHLGPLALDKTLIKWINDGLMVIFFMFAGLELKREIKAGALATPKKALFPIFGAVGGMVAPALIYILVTKYAPEPLRVWAVPAATDIAFALGVLALLGTRVPIALKAFLLALAIVDDMGAIIIIALFYTEQLAMGPLAVAGAAFAALVILNVMGVKRLPVFLAIGIILWIGMLKSGVHATVAGVLLAATIPFDTGVQESDTPLYKLEHALRPWVLFAIMPIFALANGGLSLQGISAEMLLAPATLGVALGLFLGKPIGIMGFAYAYLLATKSRFPSRIIPFWGMTHLAGIGFTMSLFINELAFRGTLIGEELKLGIYMGSGLSAIVGLALLAWSLERVVATEEQERQAVAPFLVEDEHPDDPKRG
jgi:Na+:H+ antiporter, NhaA family